MTALPEHLRAVFTAEGWIVVDRRTGRVVEPPEPEDEETCPGCGEPIDTGCPRDCPERALDDDADAYADRVRNP